MAASIFKQGETKRLLRAADRDGQTWLRDESALPALARWQEDFGLFVADVGLSTWKWRAACHMQQSVASSP